MLCILFQNRVIDSTDAYLKELEKWDCVSYIMTIAPVLNIGRENGYYGNPPDNW